MEHFHGYFVSKGSRPRDSVVFSLTPLIERMGPQMFEKRPNPEMRGPALLPPGQSHTCTTTRPVMECQIKPQTCQHAFSKPNQDLNHWQWQSAKTKAGGFEFRKGSQARKQGGTRGKEKCNNIKFRF